MKPTWRVPPLDRQVLASLCTAVLRAKLDALGNINDMRTESDNVYLDHQRYWETEHARLEVGHAWLLELLATAQP